MAYLHAENSTVCVDVMESDCGNIAEASRKGLGSVQTWKKHARVRKVSGEGRVLGSSIVHKRKAVGGMADKQRVNRGKKSRKTKVDSHQIVSTQAEGVEQPYLEL